jgi:hypothetical protein
MRKFVCLMALLLITGLARAEIVPGANDKHTLKAVGALHKRVPAAFLDTPIRVEVKSISRAQMLADTGSPYVLAYYRIDTREIRVRADRRGMDLETDVAHEYGHFVWYGLMSEAQRRDYEPIWELGKKYLYEPGEYRNSMLREGFAEAFSFWVCKTKRATEIENAYLRRLLTYTQQNLQNADQGRSKPEAPSILPPPKPDWWWGKSEYGDSQDQACGAQHCRRDTGERARGLRGGTGSQWD